MPPPSPLALIPHHSSGGKRHQHIQFVRSVPGPLSRLQLELVMACGIADNPLAKPLPSLALLNAALPLFPPFFQCSLCLFH